MSDEAEWFENWAVAEIDSDDRKDPVTLIRLLQLVYAHAAEDGIDLKKVESANKGRSIEELVEDAVDDLGDNKAGPRSVN